MPLDQIEAWLSGLASLLVLVSWIWINRLRVEMLKVKDAVIEVHSAVVQVKDAHIQRLEGERAVNLLRENLELSKAVNAHFAERKELKQRVDALQGQNAEFASLVERSRVDGARDALAESFMVLLDWEICRAKTPFRSTFVETVAFDVAKSEIREMLNVTMTKDVLPTYPRLSRILRDVMAKK